MPGGDEVLSLFVDGSLVAKGNRAARGGDGDAAGREGRRGEAQEQLLAARTARAEAGR